MEPDQPWRLAADNFTPATRTPWGGRYILDTLKADLPLGAAQRAYPVVGESWEVSVEPSFPSTVIARDGTRRALADCIAAAPEAVLGAALWRGRGGYPLLVKLLDAAQPLSVQVHPGDDYPGLSAEESGKPESWYIVHATPGAGLYLGLREGVARAEVADALERGGDLAALLNFVEVASGDCFEIEAGTIHAIGPGVTLVEPQQVLPGRRGVTYRYWDWNRRYDAAGVESPTGTARALHVAESLAVTDFSGPRGAAFVDSTRRAPTLVARDQDLTRSRYIEGPAFVVEAWRGTGALPLALETLTAAVVVDGVVTCAGQRFVRGESFALPAAMVSAYLACEDAHVVVSWPSLPG